MIEIVKGFYGLLVDGEVHRICPGDDPIELPAKREAELIESGYARAVEKPKAKQRKAKTDEPA